MAIDRQTPCYIMYVPDYVRRVKSRSCSLLPAFNKYKPRARVIYRNQKKEKLEKMGKEEDIVFERTDDRE